MAKLEKIPDHMTVIGTIKKITADFPRTIYIKIEIGDFLFNRRLWPKGYNDKFVSDEVKEFSLKQKFYKLFGIPLELSSSLIGRQCLCRKAYFQNKAYLDILEII